MRLRFALQLIALILLFPLNQTDAQTASGEQIPFSLPSSSLNTLTVENVEALERVGSIGVGSISEQVGSWSPDGQRFGVASSAGILIYDTSAWDVYPQVISDFTGGVDAVVFSQDGALIFGGCRDGFLRVWKVQTGELINEFNDWDLTRGFYGYDNLAISPDGARLVASVWSLGVVVRSINYADEQLHSEVISRQSSLGVSKVAFTPDSQFLLTLGERFEVLSIGDEYASLNTALHLNSFSNVSTFALSSDGRYFAYARYGEVKVVSMETAGTQGEFQIENVYDLAFVPNSVQLIVASDDNGIELWDGSTGTKMRDLPSQYSFIRQISIAPDASLIAYHTFSSTEIWSLEDDVNLLFEYGRQVSGRTLAFSPQNDLLFDSSGANPRGFWWLNLSSGALTRLDEAYTEQASFTAEGDWFITSEGQTAKLWYAPELVLDEVIPHYGTVSTVAIHPQGTVFATGTTIYDVSSDTLGVVRLWNFESRQLITTIEESAGNVTALAYSPEGEYLASSHFIYLCDYFCEQPNQYRILLWNTETNEVDRRLEGYTNPIAFSPDGIHFAGTYCLPDEQGTCDRTETHLLNLQTDEVRVIASNVSQLAFHPSGRLLAGSAEGGEIILFNGLNGEYLTRLQAYHEYVGDIAFSPDGTLLASIGGGSSSILWLWGVPAE